VKTAAKKKILKDLCIACSSDLVKLWTALEIDLQISELCPAVGDWLAAAGIRWSEGS
jgi:hypothetical protein